jgi:hypothetical protein
MLEDEITAALRPIVQGHVDNAQDLLVHPHRRPQGNHKSNLPGLVYNLVSLICEENDDLCGSELIRIRTSVDCYCDSEPTSTLYGYKGARLLAYQVNYALRTIGLPGEPNRGGRLLTMTPFADDAEKLYRWTVEHEFWRSLAEAEGELGLLPAVMTLAVRSA